ncbi:CAP domain-containing protein [Halovulum dunhuangense]|uniref:CAP domain-containing protein n=1 Tax=Halovulum dunhuangense TaxID=1505036 RepID=A0A849KZP1_9RHOB|nr:CAP domain-containing protein [Halovulum dunhuangense]NNU79404.1 CAP domain-containing protein [Halovulum dunhuangense]
MVSRGIRAFLVLLAVAACTPPEPESVNGIRIIQDSEVNGILTAHVDGVNAFRGSRGLTPVRLSSQLTAAAATHARDMSVQRRAWHFGSDGTSPRDRALRAGFQGEVLGENISESFDDDVSVLQSWLNDPFTRRVMEAPEADSVGFSFYQEPNGKLWWVQLLGDSSSRPAVGAGLGGAMSVPGS